MSPTAASHQLRLEVLTRLKNVVTGLWPDARIEPFGSFATGLYLPTSDLDVVIFGLWTSIPFTTLDSQLRTIAAPGSIEVIDTAAVPIIKYDDMESGIKVDISFNSDTGPRTAQLIKLFKRQYPDLPKLALVLKQLLLERDLSTVFTGGLSSYCLILMIVSFLQTHSRRLSNDDNLGVLLLEFLEHYGRNFNYDRLVISVRKVNIYYYDKIMN